MHRNASKACHLITIAYLSHSSSGSMIESHTKRDSHANTPRWCNKHAFEHPSLLRSALIEMDTVCHRRHNYICFLSLLLNLFFRPRLSSRTVVLKGPMRHTRRYSRAGMLSTKGSEIRMRTGWKTLRRMLIPS